MEIVLFERSNTQRVVLVYASDSCLIGKEWRKAETEEWVRGKSIDIPIGYIQKVIDALVEVQKEKDNGKAENTNSDNKKTNNRH